MEAEKGQGQFNPSTQQAGSAEGWSLGLAGDVLGNPSLTSSRQTMSSGSLSPSVPPCVGKSVPGYSSLVPEALVHKAPRICKTLSPFITLQILKVS